MGPNEGTGQGARPGVGGGRGLDPVSSRGRDTLPAEGGYGIVSLRTILPPFYA